MKALARRFTPIVRVRLEFVRGGPTGRHLPRALLAIGIAGVVYAGIEYLRLSSSIAEDEARLAALRDQHKLANTRARADPARDKRHQLAQAHAVELVRSLATPWPQLFGELEGATLRAIALTAMEPDPQAGRVRIAGEAERFADLVAYLQALNARPSFSRVLLTSHERAAGSARVAFALEAHWSGAR